MRKLNNRKIVVSEFVTLDGIVEEPEKWIMSYNNEEIGKFKFDELFASDALLLGRMTYQIFADYWPSATDEATPGVGYVNRMNSILKFVVSKTLQQVEWKNSRLIKGDIVEEVAKLKHQPGKDILIYGSGALVNTLMQYDLIDEYRLLVYPVVLGSGKRLFKDGSNATLKLVETKTFSSGVVLLRYQPVGTGEKYYEKSSFIYDHFTDNLYSDLAELRKPEVIQELIRTTGAAVMGRHAYNMAEGDFTGYEFQAPIFVLTYDVPERAAKGENENLRFTFVFDQITKIGSVNTS
jgi:dihydrofolate reductase